MNYTTKQIKQGVKVHFLNTSKFKTDLVAVFLSVPLARETVTKNALMTSILRRGSMAKQSMDQISIELENMYGAEFDCGIEKLGDNHILKFYIESVNDEFIMHDSNVLEKNIEIISEIIFDPLVENNGFKVEYVNQEKANLKQLIEGKIDDKDQYSFDRCCEEMYRNKAHGLYRYGYVEDLENIDPKELYEYYKEIIDVAKIDIFICGQISNDKVLPYIESIKYVKDLKERQGDYVADNPENEERDIITIEESMDVAQGKLIMGLKIDEKDTSCRFVASVYNALLGGSANSKLFQNIREKESLAYTIGSRFVRQKNNIYIKCGIDLENYEKTVKLIGKELEDIKNGSFTDKDIDNAKIFLDSSVKMIEDEQDLSVTYYIGQELSKTEGTLEDYLKEVQKVTKEQIVELANKVEVDTIYFLRN